jgi:hypothetical protein
MPLYCLRNSSSWAPPPNGTWKRKSKRSDSIRLARANTRLLLPNPSVCERASCLSTISMVPHSGAQSPQVLLTEMLRRGALGSSSVGVLQLRPEPLTHVLHRIRITRFQDPWRSPELEDIDDVGRIYGDVRGNGMVGPQVHPGVTCPQGQHRLDHAGAEVLEH